CFSAHARLPPFPTRRSSDLSLREHCVTVLGNHDLSLLAIAERTADEQRKVNPDLQRVLFAPDSAELLDWLRGQPLLHEDRDLGRSEEHTSELQSRENLVCRL